MDDMTRKELNQLFGYCLRTDARFMALQKTVGEFLKLNEEHREAFNADVEANFKIFEKVILDDVAKQNPELAHELGRSVKRKGKMK